MPSQALRAARCLLALALVALLATGCEDPRRAATRLPTAGATSAAATASAIPTPAVTATAAATATPTPTATASAAVVSAAVSARVAPASATPAIEAARPAAPVSVPVSAAASAVPAGAMPTPVGSTTLPRRPTANAASAGFPPPAAKGTTSPPNAGGLARIVSTKFHLNHYIDVLGVVDNVMEAPDHDGSYAVGWYASFGAPGVPGNAVFSAHETWNHLQGPFYFMHTAELGDQLTLELTGGQRYTYEVINTARYTVDTIPMGDLLWPTNRPPSEQWITLITCGGAIVYHGAFGDYVDRDVVVMRRVS